MVGFIFKVLSTIIMSGVNIVARPIGPDGTSAKEEYEIELSGPLFETSGALNESFIKLTVIRKLFIILVFSCLSQLYLTINSGAIFKNIQIIKVL